MASIAFRSQSTRDASFMPCGYRPRLTRSSKVTGEIPTLVGNLSDIHQARQRAGRPVRGNFGHYPLCPQGDVGSEDALFGVRDTGIPQGVLKYRNHRQGILCRADDYAVYHGRDIKTVHTPVCAPSERN